MAADITYGWALLKANMKAALSLRAAYAIRSLFALANHIIYIFLWFILFKTVPSIGGWRIEHVLLAYGIGIMVWGLISFLAYGLRTLPRQIEHGDLDSYLTQPRALLLNIALGTTQASGPGEVIFGLILMVYAAILTGVSVLWLLLVIVFATLIFASIVLAYASLGFWLRGYHTSAEEMYFNFFIISNRPEGIFTGWMKIMIMTIIPVSFMTHIPLHFLLDHQWGALGWTVLGTLGCMAAGYSIFRLGLRHYESGNRFGIRG